jgi:hypothetical protein
MNRRNRIEQEIAKQKSIEPEKCQDKILLALLRVLKTQEQWLALVDVEHRPYGKLSYETNRFYHPKTELMAFIKIITETEES